MIQLSKMSIKIVINYFQITPLSKIICYHYSFCLLFAFSGNKIFVFFSCTTNGSNWSSHDNFLLSLLLILFFNNFLFLIRLLTFFQCFLLYFFVNVFLFDCVLMFNHFIFTFLLFFLSNYISFQIKTKTFVFHRFQPQCLFEVEKVHSFFGVLSKIIMIK